MIHRTSFFTISIVFTLLFILLFIPIKDASVMGHPQALALEFPLHINVGSDKPYTTANNVIFQADQPWSTNVEYGHVDGVALSKPDFWLINGTDDAPLYRSFLKEWQAYRVNNIPTGDYLVTLHFAELYTHGPGLTVFEVSIEGQLRLDNFDPFAEAGLDYALDRSFSVSVSDGELTIEAQTIAKHPHLAGISLEPIAVDAVAPNIPTGFKAIPSYETTILTWDAASEPDIDGYHIYRSSAATGPYTQLTTEPVHITRYIDQYKDLPTLLPDKPSDSPWYYQISSVDIHNNQSSVTPPLVMLPLSIDSIDLPVYELEIAPADLATMAADIWLSDNVDATLTFENQQYPARVRFRGNFSREYPKKSWKIIFPDDSPYANRDRLNLKSHYDDPTMMRGPLTTALYQKVGMNPPTTDLAVLFVNGEYLGVFSDYEQVNKFFMERTGRNPESIVYEPTWTPYANYGDLLPDIDAYREGYQIKNNDYFGYDDLISFIELINNTSDQFFPSRLLDTFEIKRYLDYYAVVILTNNVEFTRHDLRILQDRDTGRWEFIPWDPDYTWGYVYPFSTAFDTSQPINTGTLSNPGSVFHGPNRFLSRVMDVPEYRAYFCSRLSEITSDNYVTTQIFPLIDAYYELIKEEATADWWKAEGTRSTLFESSANDLKQFVQERTDFLRSEIPGYCIDPQSLLRINEIVTQNVSSYCDPADANTASCYDDWIEIYNPNLEAVDMQGLYLTDTPDNPTKFQITESTIIPPMDSVLVWADSEPQQGANHANFDLDVSDLSVNLYAADGITEIDRIDVPQLLDDESFGRYPDGADAVYEFEVTTPTTPNQVGLIFEQVTIEPQIPTAGDTVTVTVQFFEESSLNNTELYYNIPTDGWQSTALVRKDTGNYEAVIPAQVDGTLVRYYISATSTTNKVITEPSYAPLKYFDYLVGYRKPAVIINEILAKYDPLNASSANPGEIGSWIELHNPGSASVSVTGMYLSDNPNIPRKYRIPGRLLIPARGYMIFYANATPEETPWDTNFVLDKSGGTLSLYDTDDNQNRQIDSRTYPGQVDGRSEYRCYNHIEIWHSAGLPTPGGENRPACSVMFLPIMGQE